MKPSAAGQIAWPWGSARCVAVVQPRRATRGASGGGVRGPPRRAGDRAGWGERGLPRRTPPSRSQCGPEGPVPPSRRRSRVPRPVHPRVQNRRAGWTIRTSWTSTTPARSTDSCTCPCASSTGGTSGACSRTSARSIRGGRWRSPRRSRPRSTPPTRTASSTATSSPATSCYRARDPDRACVPVRFRHHEAHGHAGGADEDGPVRRDGRLRGPRTDPGRG